MGHGPYFAQRSSEPALVPVSATRMAVLLAVVRGAGTVRQVAFAAGVSLPTAHTHLVRLRACGFVSWEDRTAGTLRALVEEVPVAA